PHTFREESGGEASCSAAQPFRQRKKELPWRPAPSRLKDRRSWHYCRRARVGRGRSARQPEARLPCPSPLTRSPTPALLEGRRPRPLQRRACPGRVEPDRPERRRTVRLPAEQGSSRPLP